MTKYNPQKHHRRSIRLKGYDYSQPGAYFITIVAHNHENLFGEIIKEEMHLSNLGKIVQEEWMRSAIIRKEIHLNNDEFVIMPNHMHGIVWVVSSVGADGVRPDDLNTMGASLAPPQNLEVDGEGACHAPLQRKPRSLSSFIAGFKSAVTSRGRCELSLADIWQRNYHDHIIRDRHELEQIWEYIQTNPYRWKEDQLNHKATMGGK